MGLEGLESTSSSTQLGANATPSTGLNLTKGAKLDLTKGNPSLDRLVVGLGWDVDPQPGETFDLDAEVFLVNENEKTPTQQHLVYYSNKVSPDGAIRHNGDNLTGDGAGDDETINVQLSKVSPEVQKLIFTVTIYEAMAKRQNFGQVNNAYIHISDEATGKEVCRFDLSEDYSTSISLIAGEVYRHNGEWKFNAKGEGSTKDLAGLCQQFGVM